MGWVLITIVIIISIFVGIFGGLFIAKFVFSRQEKEIMKNAEEVLAGKRENKLEVNGIKYDAIKFRIRDEDGKERIIDLTNLQGGTEEENDTTKKENIRRKERESPKKDSPSIRGDAPNSERKKRVTRSRNGIIRRFN